MRTPDEVHEIQERSLAILIARLENEVDAVLTNPKPNIQPSRILAAFFDESSRTLSIVFSFAYELPPGVSECEVIKNLANTYTQGGWVVHYSPRIHPKDAKRFLYGPWGLDPDLPNHVALVFEKYPPLESE